jgi:hypothetical protein
MANRADVLVKNKVQGKDVKVERILPDNLDYETILTSNGQEEINMEDTNVELVINAPGGIDPKLFGVSLDSAVDMEMRYSRTDGNWTFKIVPNQLDPEVPTTVNIEIGDLQPE